MVRLSSFTYIDLFAGCGGLSLGLYNSGNWHGLFAVEKSSDAFATLKYNLIENNSHFSWPDWLRKKNHNIDSVLKNHESKLRSLRGKVDLVAGGPPCQGFSTAGRRIEKDHRNKLIHSYLKFIEFVQPRAILFENVKGFKIGFRQADHSRGVPYSEVVIKLLKKLGYNDSQARLIDFSDYGIPQQRKRCIIVGTKNRQAPAFFKGLESSAPDFLQSKGLGPRQDLESAISDILREHGEIVSPDMKRFQAGLYSEKPLTSFQKLMRTRANPMPDSHRFPNHTPEVEAKFKTIIKEKLNSAQIRKRFSTRKCSTKLLSAELPTPTLTTLPDDYVHYCEPRILTVREYARIQSFPDWYEFKGKYTTGGKRRKVEVPRYSQIGNAIPPLFAELAGNTLMEILSDG